MAEVADDAVAAGDGEVGGLVDEFVEGIGSCQLG